MIDLVVELKCGYSMMLHVHVHVYEKGDKETRLIGEW